MHFHVDGQSPLVSDANGVLNNPQHQSMRPPRRVGVREVLVNASADLSERRTDKVLGVGDRNARLADLAHGGRHEVADNKLHVDAVRLELRSERAGPVLQERLGARVRSQVGRGDPASEGAHGEDEARLALLHDGGDDLGGLEGAEAVDGDDVLELLAGGLDEGNGDAVGLADVVDEDADVEAGDELGETVVVGAVVAGVVHGEDLDLDLAGELGLELVGKGLKLGLGSGDEDEVEALAGELVGVFLAQAVGGTGHDCPGAGLAILAELFKFLLVTPSK